MRRLHAKTDRLTLCARLMIISAALLNMWLMLILNLIRLDTCEFYSFIRLDVVPERKALGASFIKELAFSRQQ